MEVLDFETGEKVYEILNRETGEREYPSSTVFHSKSPRKGFRVPSHVYSSVTQPEAKQLKPTSDFYESITYLLPTVVLVSPLLIVFLIVLEIVLHTRTHVKNEKLDKNSNIYYQSPLHLISKEFCGKCKSEAQMKIIKGRDFESHSCFIKHSFEFLKRMLT
ncbi:uncharacterized protein LOC109600227 [Aethina tumida]|uniref:uncharacterized protein LOC109600227 n=1 Tax=Aethina tumida TaxID=116153 RepID=UPI00096AEAAA|nr:uncharacterized protein LOC109600227 [Aethina tumida]